LPGAMRGPLHELHERLGARFVDFSGFQMPVQYSSIKQEHEAVRERAGLFDVSHMGNLRIDGPGAARLLDHATVSRIEDLKEGHGVYTVILSDDGHIKDDTIVYRFEQDRYYMVPNAGQNESTAEHLRALAEHLDLKVNITDASRETCIFALQGPAAVKILEEAGAPTPENPRFRLHTRELAGQLVWVATTGYTGETGYEFFVDARSGQEVFERLLMAGEADGIRPAGLGARDTLRLEAGFALAGNEFEGGRSPLEAGLAWTVNWDHDFVGKEALLKQKEARPKERLVGLKMLDRAIARAHHPVQDEEGEPIGTVTSGTKSPTLGDGIAMAYLDRAHAKKGTQVQVEIRGKTHPAEVVKMPFLNR
jgi:aminomethyltransferase